MSDTATPKPTVWTPPPPPPHPLRASIDGDEEKIPALKEIVMGYERIDLNLRQFLCTRLDRLKSNAGSVHLVDVDFADGGCDIHISTRAKHHGKIKMVQGTPTPAETQV